MINAKLIRHLIIAGILGLFTVLSTGCGWNPSDEERQQIEEAHNAALSAERSLEDSRQETRRLESELAQKKQNLQKTKDAKAATQDRVNAWDGGDDGDDEDDN